MRVLSQHTPGRQTTYPKIFVFRTKLSKTPKNWMYLSALKCEIERCQFQYVLDQEHVVISPFHLQEENWLCDLKADVRSVLVPDVRYLVGQLKLSEYKTKRLSDKLLLSEYTDQKSRSTWWSGGSHCLWFYLQPFLIETHWSDSE